MPLYKLILGRIFAVYMLIVFVILLIPAFLLFAIVNNTTQGQKREAYIHSVFVVWMALYLPLVFCRVRRYGLQHFEQGRSYVIVANHSSLMDIPVSSLSIPLPNKTLGKSSFAKVPVFGYIYKLGSILVDRSSSRSKAQSFILMKQALQSGLSVCLYPEGTRNKTSEPLLPFHDGAFRLAQNLQVPIIPAIIKGTKKVLPADAPILWAWPHQLSITFLPQVSTTHKSVEELSQHVRALMLEHI